MARVESCHFSLAVANSKKALNDGDDDSFALFGIAFSDCVCTDLACFGHRASATFPGQFSSRCIEHHSLGSLF